ncbi:MAG: maleylpyruvate isomerase family mycothiol-dependent enzyme [Dermatophilaceae bacterium]
MSPADLRPRADVELVERALAFTRGALAGVSDAEAGAATPCGRWTLTELLVHLVDSLEVVTELALGRVSAAGPPPESVRPELLAQHLRVLGCALLDGWVTRASGPDAGDVVVHDGRAGHDGGARRGGRARLDVGTASGLAALEVAVHGWDVARARGVATPFPPLLAAALLPVAAVVVPVHGRGGLFAPPLRPPATDPASVLLAHLGRDPGWVPP